MTMKLVGATALSILALTCAAQAGTQPPDQGLALGLAAGGDISQLDADHDGWVSREEASAAAARAFAKLDVNGDGRLDRGDAREAPGPHIFRFPGDASSPQDLPPFLFLLATIDEADTNGDGAISLDEYVAYQLRFFDAGDGNHDGRIRIFAPDGLNSGR